MPNPTRISLPRVNYNFDAKACVPVLTVMLNKVEKDYSTVDELCDHDELSKFTRDEMPLYKKSDMKNHQLCFHLYGFR